MSDPVKSPDHYKLGNGLEVLDVITALGWRRDYLRANALKYLCRHQGKGDPVQDLKKARYCLDLLIEEMEAADAKLAATEEDARRGTFDALDHRKARDEWSHLLPVCVQDPIDDLEYHFSSTADDVDPGGDR